MIVIDFETRSKLDIREVGTARYSNDPSTEILMLGYKIDNGPIKQWFPFHDTPDFVASMHEHTIYAFNSFFEWSIWNNILVPRFNWPELHISNMQDVQAICARFGLPQNLEQAAKVLRAPVQKDTLGKRLINLFCKPPFGHNVYGRIDDKFANEWKMFKKYNRNDVETTYGVLKRLPFDKLDRVENYIWQLNHEINTRGIPVCVDEAEQILKVTQAYLEEHNARLPDLTNGMVEKITQVARIKKWMEKLGYPCESLNAEELPKWLSRTDLPEALTEVLEIRAGMGLSSLGKYKRILNEAYNGRMYNNSRYYGAHTGRITGMGFQLLNLPRASVKDPEAEIKSFFDLSICEHNPVLSARALIRSMVKTSEDKVLLVADYASIEYILLMYMCEEWEAVRRFKEGMDQYKDLATHMYNVPYDKVTKDQRQMGKMGILGCGYGLGAQGFVGYADRWGVKVDLATARETVQGFRKKYPNVQNFWYRANDCAMNAVLLPGHDFSCYRTTWEMWYDRNRQPWLIMHLPSGRKMYYFNPVVEEGKFSLNVTSWSVNQTTKTWSKKYMSPGKWVENIIQALGRDLLYYGKSQLEQNGFPIIFSVYDEAVSEVPKERADLDLFCKLLSTTPKWAEGLPLRADGYVSQRYKKG